MSGSPSVCDLPDAALYEQLAERHGHYCPMSTLGLRLGWEARTFTGVVETITYAARTCAVDGICLALGLESLPTAEEGLHQLQIVSDGREIRIGLSPYAMELAASYRTLDEEGQQRLLQQLRQLPGERILSIDNLESD